MNPFERALRTVTRTVAKAVVRVQGSPRGVISEYSPFSAQGLYGQPRQSMLGNQFTVTPARMREIAMKSPTLAASVNTILDYTTGVPITLRNTNPAEDPPARASRLVRDLIDNPNNEDDDREFRKKLYEDLIVLGFAAVEIEPGEDGSPAANLYVLDGANLYLDYDEHGITKGYTQLDPTGNPIIGRDKHHTFTPDEVIFYKLDPQTKSKWPRSRIEQVFACAVIEQMMLAFIGGRFSESNIPFGVMDLGELTEGEIKAAVGYWNQQVEESEHPEHRIIFTGSKGSSGAKWLPFGYSLGELEAPDLLAAVKNYIMSVLGITANEMGQGDNVNKSNGFQLSYTFKKRAVEPVLECFVHKTTSHLIVKVLGVKNLELFYEEIDSRDELLESQIEKLYIEVGVYSLNYVRNKKGLPNIPGGEEPMVNLGAAMVPVSMLRDFAQAQLDALHIINLQSQVAIMQTINMMTQPQVDAEGNPIPGTGNPDAQSLLKPMGSLPLMRMMQPPERFTTPDASGSSSFKFNLPKPLTNIRPKGAAPSTAPRGVVESGQRAGLRKDDQHE